MTDITVSTYEAKTQLSKLLDACVRGAGVVITRNAKPIARLVPVEDAPRREFGFLPLHLDERDEQEAMAPLDPSVLPDWMSQAS